MISHIRHGLDHHFPCSTHGETDARLAHRMANVQAYMNSSEFMARGGGGLASLARSLHVRCRQVIDLQGERLRT